MSISCSTDFIEFVRKFRLERPKVRTVVISNTDKRISNILSQLGVMPFIDAVVYSEEVACSKPSPGIFEKAIEKSELKDLAKDGILHVGDDLVKDYHGAKALGWNSLLLNRNNLNPENFDGVPEKHLCNNFQNVDQFICDQFKE
jgi:putative hydrolase of the HAD superfamily